MKKIVITGASSGVGAGVASLLVKQGHTVIGVARSKEKLEALKKHLENEKGMFHCCVGDLSKSNFENAIKGCINQLGLDQIDVLINNAGYLVNKPFGELSMSDWQAVYDVNVFGPVRLIRSLYALLEKSSGSHILNISSIGGINGTDKFPGLSAYSSSKGALSILTEVLGKEFAKDGVHVNALDLGSVQTEMLEKAFPEYRSPTTVEQMARFIAMFALNGQEVCNGKNIPIALTSI